MGEHDLGGRVGPPRVVAARVGANRRRIAHYVTSVDGRYTYTACRKAMTQVRSYGGNAVPLCKACGEAVARDRQG